MEFLESKTVTRDLVDILIGKKLGQGIGREVYECLMDKTLVVKIELPAESFQNIIEWKLWNEVKESKKISAWFAPCIAISPCGTVLLQKRCEVSYRKDYPKLVPEFLVDRKYGNYGMLNGRLVCFDYGTSLFSNGLSGRMRKADWWE